VNDTTETIATLPIARGGRALEAQGVSVAVATQSAVAFASSEGRNDHIDGIVCPV